jgi:hypothetical protein
MALIPLAMGLDSVDDAVRVGIGQIRMGEVGEYLKIAFDDCVVTLIFQGANELFSIFKVIHD